MNNTYGWDTPPNDVMEKYIQKCKLFSESDYAFDTFKQDEDYKKILEGGDYIIGEILLNMIINSHSEDIPLIQDNLEKFKENDIYGSPSIYNYMYFGNICPTTIKYIYNLLDIKSLVGNNKLNKIVEVGGGYGAMCKTLSVLYDFDEYILIDLPEVISLCKKYMSKFDDIKNKITYISCDQFENIESIENVDLFISDSCLSECDGDTQKKYINKILKNSKFAYIVYNTLHLENARKNYSNIIKDMATIFDIKENVPRENIRFMFFDRKEQ